MTKLFEKAKPALPYLRIALMGNAGSGKTFTALTLGEGLAKREDKKLAVIDTDPGSPAALYAPPMGKIEFDTVKPANAGELIDIVESFDTDTYGVLVLDTITWLWRAVQNLDTIEKTKAGTVPFGSWQKLKTLYREVLMPMVNMPCHTIITGRETVEYDLSGDDIHAVGFKMIAEKETPYETNLFIRLIQRRAKVSEAIPQAHLAEVLRDRTGILQGQIFKNMNYESIEPLVKVLCGELVPEPDETEQAIGDQVLLERPKDKMAEAEKKSMALRMKFEDKIWGAKDNGELDKITKEITKTLKRDLLEADREKLRGTFTERKGMITDEDISK